MSKETAKLTLLALAGAIHELADGDNLPRGETAKIPEVVDGTPLERLNYRRKLHGAEELEAVPTWVRFNQSEEDTTPPTACACLFKGNPGKACFYAGNYSHYGGEDGHTHIITLRDGSGGNIIIGKEEMSKITHYMIFDRVNRMLTPLCDQIAEEEEYQKSINDLN